MTSPGDCGADMPTCEDCYFRQELLCALAGNAICPTFRAARQAPSLYPVPAEPDPERERRPVAA